MENPYVLLETTLGDILIELLPESAPKSVANFLQYVDAKHYDYTIFHRVIRGFMIQGGGYDNRLQRREALPPVENEAKGGLSNLKGTVALARATEKDSASDEFFINAEDNLDLDHMDDTDENYGYTVFGRVVEGMDVVKKINWKVTKPRNDFDDLPVDDIEIISARRFE
ncbi:peptidylprolyl isomerase [Desulfovibrio mangrovi]|uniref:peptidylprolyl isomerase n=1 Tax=Desulfovibrio mangrovi TaxID=2976983 RepID=UPI0022479CDD|nr:peptidylprolyl isomerase [Desulfovibrio mangrovi]UZP67995.1 peptidylprolyl isomerase [Desulfovibrio mangrovi]